jgi:hypothetical protein
MSTCHRSGGSATSATSSPASASGPRHGERERQLASDRSPTPEPEHTWVDLDALHAQRMAARPPEYRPADRDNSR